MLALLGHLGEDYFTQIHHTKVSIYVVRCFDFDPCAGRACTERSSFLPLDIDCLNRSSLCDYKSMLACYTCEKYSK